MNECIFCQIYKKEVASNCVYENKFGFAFLDIHPINPGHTLVIPKMHIEDFYDLKEDYIFEIMKIVKEIAGILKREFKPKKVGMIVTGFDVAHAHVHVLPMYDYHDVTSIKILENKRGNPTLEELKDIENKIRRSI